MGRCGKSDTSSNCSTRGTPIACWKHLFCGLVVDMTGLSEPHERACHTTIYLHYAVNLTSLELEYPPPRAFISLRPFEVLKPKRQQHHGLVVLFRSSLVSIQSNTPSISTEYPVLRCMASNIQQERTGMQHFLTRQAPWLLFAPLRVPPTFQAGAVRGVRGARARSHERAGEVPRRRRGI